MGWKIWEVAVKTAADRATWKKMCSTLAAKLWNDQQKVYELEVKGIPIFFQKKFKAYKAIR